MAACGPNCRGGPAAASMLTVTTVPSKARREFSLSEARPRDIPSPCVAICMLSPETGYCRGCYRSIAEIAGWLKFDRAERLACLERLAERRAEDLARPRNPEDEL